MIRSIIKISILFAVLVSTSSISQLAVALDLDIDNDISSEAQYPFAWAPGDVSIHNGQNLKSLTNQPVQKSLYGSETEERKFSFEIYQGDGLDDLRKNPEGRSKWILPKEDYDSYGITIKQRF